MSTSETASPEQKLPREESHTNRPTSPNQESELHLALTLPHHLLPQNRCVFTETSIDKAEPGSAWGQLRSIGPDLSRMTYLMILFMKKSHP